MAHFLTVLIFGGLFYFGYRPLFIVMARLFRGIDDAYIMWLLAVGLLVLAFVIFILISKLLGPIAESQYVGCYGTGFAACCSERGAVS